MRTALLPPHLSIWSQVAAATSTSTAVSSSVGEGHRIITLSSSALREYCHSHAPEGEQQEQVMVMPLHLTAQHWSEVFTLWQRFTRPSEWYTLTSPGVTLTRRSTGSSPRWNGVCFHVVPRQPDDFLPNNLVYHYLQQWYPFSAHASTSAPPQEGVSAEMFNEFLEQLSSGSIPDDGMTSSAAPAAVASTGDPLEGLEEAKIRTANNQLIAALPLPDHSPTSSAPPQTFYFNPYPVDVYSCVPYRSAHFSVLVNLKPIVPLHLMVVPHRCVGTISGLTEAEVVDLGRVTRLSLQVLHRIRSVEQQQAGSASQFDSMNFSITIQQGTGAGQTVPHLHLHLIPFDVDGKLSAAPEPEEEEQRRRPPRTLEMMREDTARLREVFELLLKAR